MGLQAFVGIDVAFAKLKRLPIVMCTKDGSRLIPLPLRSTGQPLPPRGRGNRAALNPLEVDAFALESLQYLRDIERTNGLTIQRIAIDAPSDYKYKNIPRRAAELAMDERGISCFATPSRTEFEAIRQKAERHLKAGGAENRLPHANQLWMLVGFALFEVLRNHYECIEVFPQAIAHALQSQQIHKSKAAGVEAQLTSVSIHSGWPSSTSAIHLKQICFGSLHDKLDAYLSAWVASLGDNESLACGEEPHDVIWIPRVR